MILVAGMRVWSGRWKGCVEVAVKECGKVQVGKEGHAIWKERTQPYLMMRSGRGLHKSKRVGLGLVGKLAAQFVTK